MERNFSSLVPVLKRRFLPAFITFASVIGGAIAYLIFTPPVYEVTAKLLVDDKRLSVSELGRDLVQLPNNRNDAAKPSATQAELIKSQRVLARAVEQVFPDESSPQQEQRVEKLSKKLEVAIIPATNILELNYKNENGELATRIVNAVAQATVKESTEVIRQEAKAVKDFLEVKVPQQRAATEAAEAAENKYRKNSGIVNLNEQTESLVESLALLENQERDILAQLQEKTAQARELQRITQLGSVSSAYTAGRVGQDQELEELRTKIANLDAELASSRSRLTDNHPDVQSLVQERDSLVGLYNQRVASVSSRGQGVSPAGVASDELSQSLTANYITTETERQALASRLGVVQAERARLQNRLDQLPLQQQPLAALVRQREEATRSLEFLQGKLEEARIAEAQLVSNVRIIDQAQIPSDSAWPSSKVVLVIATAAGLALAVGTVLLLETLDNTMHDVSETERMLKVPILGVLPEVPVTAFSLERPEQFLDDFSLVEPYRLLLKTLDFQTEENLRMLVVSSTVSGEGKSVVTAHLGALAAMLSRRTLIIDADLRRSKQHTLLGVTPQPGLSNVIEGQLSLLEAAQPTGIDKLSVLTSGTLSSRPSALLDSAAMQSLLGEASAAYDLVIVDTPPITSCADAHSLSRRSDGLIVITRPNFTPKDTLYRSVQDLKSKGIPLLGVVVNGITAHTEKYYRYAIDGYSDFPEGKLGLTHPEMSKHNSSPSA